MLWKYHYSYILLSPLFSKVSSTEISKSFHKVLPEKNKNKTLIVNNETNK